MTYRNIFFTLGIVALIGGLGLLFFHMVGKPARNASVQGAAANAPTILVAAHPIGAGSLLQATDIRWQAAGPRIDPESFVQGQAPAPDVVGAVARRDFQTGEALVARQLAKPGDHSFLAAVLAPGDRAVSIAVSPVAGMAGLMAPGDHVDVILMQTFNASGSDSGRKASGESILRNVRILAIDQAMSFVARPGAPPNGIEQKAPRTVTLEVTERQAQALLVAVELGKVELVLRSSAGGSADAGQTVATSPTWAADVSAALTSRPQAAPEPRRVAPEPPKAKDTAAPAPALQVIRGTSVEHRCARPGDGQLVDCGSKP